MEPPQPDHGSRTAAAVSLPGCGWGRVLSGEFSRGSGFFFVVVLVFAILVGRAVLVLLFVFVFLVLLILGFLVVFAAVVRVVFLGFLRFHLLFFAAQLFGFGGRGGFGGFGGFLFEPGMGCGFVAEFLHLGAEGAEAGFGNRATLLQAAAAGLHGFPEGVAAGVEEGSLRAGG